MIEVNLLPKELRRRSGGLGISKTSRVAVAVAVLFVGLIAGATYYQRVQLVSITDDIARAEAKAQRMEKDIELVDRLVDVKTRIVRRLAAIETLDRNRAAWVQNMEDLATVIPDFLWLSEFRQGDEKTGVRSRTKTGPEQPINADSIAAVKNTLTLQGYCYTVSSLANFILNLQDSPRFSDIQLRYAKGTELNERRVYDFQVSCRLEPVDTEAKGFQDMPAGSETLGDEATGDEELLGMMPPDEDQY